MSAAKLNVEISGSVGGLVGALKQAVQELDRMDAKAKQVDRPGFMQKATDGLSAFGNKAQSIGGLLTANITGPFAAIAALGLKAAGDYENLRNAITTTMTDAGRTTKEAMDEVEQLRKAALAPGLDFEQAVRASIRLQNVGFKAEEARKIVQELANAITMSGGTADDLDGVTKQFSQMISKGRVLQEDLSIIAERMPKVAELSKKAFGTFNAEGLRDKGIDAQMFVAGITKEMEKLTRVQGGISNSIVNAGTAVKQFLGVIGEEINKAFDVGKRSEQFAAWLGRTSEGLSKMSEPTKQWVLGLGLVLAATGPVIKIVGLLSSALGTMVSVVGATITGVKSLATTIKAASTIGNFTFLLSSLTLLLPAIAAVTLAMGGFSREASLSEKIGSKLADMHSQITAEYSKESASITNLFDRAKNYRLSTEERTAALRQLKQEYPQYIGNLDLEKMSLQELGGAQQMVLDNLKEGIKQRIKQASIVSELEKQAKAEIRLNKIRQEGFSALSGQEVTDAGLSLFGTDFEKKFVSEEGKKLALKNIEAFYGKVLDESRQTVNAINKEFDDLNSADNFYAFRDAEENYKKTVTVATKAGNAGRAEMSESLKKLKEQQGLYKDILESIAGAKEAGKVLGDGYERQADAIGNGIEKLLEKGFTAGSKEVQHLLKLSQELRDTLGAVQVSPTEGNNALIVAKQLTDSAENLRKAIAAAQSSGGADSQAVDAVVKQAEELRYLLGSAKLEGIGLADDNTMQALVSKAMALKDNLSASKLPLDFAGSPDTLERLALQAADLKTALVQALSSPNANFDALRAQAEALSQTLDGIAMPVLPEAQMQLGGMQSLATGIATTLANAKATGLDMDRQRMELLVLEAESIHSTLADVQVNEGLFDGLNMGITKAIENIKTFKTSLSTGLPAIASNTQLSPVSSQTATGGVPAPAPAALMPVDVVGQAMESLDAYTESVKRVNEAHSEIADAAAPAFATLANSLAGLQGAYKDSGVAALVAAAQFVKAALAATLASAIKDSFTKSGHPLIGLALAGVAVAGVEALFGSIMKKANKMPKFADGGMVYGTTIGMLGEYPGAGSNPEVIAPLSDLQGMLGGNVVVVGGNVRFTGRDLLLAIEAEQRTNKRSI